LQAGIDAFPACCYHQVRHLSGYPALTFIRPFLAQFITTGNNDFELIFFKIPYNSQTIQEEQGVLLQINKGAGR
jgi:hypothetical protein